MDISFLLQSFCDLGKSVSFSYWPLRLSLYTGVCTAACGLVTLLYLVVREFLMGIVVPGYAWLAAVVLFLGGLQLLVIGFMGEYLARIHTEVLHRPLYVVSETLGVE